ncbi:DUF1592 domain-containing protein [Sandaracinus amylolyticus]|uniref:DUF1592 domain-containing protein n=1 Tax=Sandaracinus amylolyticus TaxID=927083 RepID=UPI0014700B45|nr:DUF1592 domain-containing protein [Sandaracinus amylolyticus]
MRHAVPLAVILLLAALSGCGDDLPIARPLPTGRATPSLPEPLRRLSRVEHERTLRDLFPGTALPLLELPPDTELDRLENDARSLGPSQLGIARYEESARAVASAVMADERARARVLSCDAWSTPSEQEACVDAFVAGFAMRALRRPPSEDEAERLRSRIRAWTTQTDFLGAIELAVQMLLQTPSFLYRTEPSVDDDDEIIAVDGYEMASRLSYALWQSMPDDALFEAAASGALSSREGVEREARRMIADARAGDTIVDFHRQWLDLDRILEPEHAVRADGTRSDWDARTQRDAHAEALRFVRIALVEGDGRLASLLESPEAELSGRLARLYDVGTDPSWADDEWRRVTLPDERRAGILTRVAVLASHAHPGYASPPLRGSFVLETLLCAPRTSPPADVDLSQPRPSDGEGPRTNRELFAQRTSSALCQGCHVRLDGIGFGLEHYDAAGVWRDVEVGVAIDTAGALHGTDVDGPFDGALELSRRLATSRDVHACYTRRWLQFVRGRPADASEQFLLAELEERFAESGGDVRALMLAIVTHPSFARRTAVGE